MIKKIKDPIIKKVINKIIGRSEVGFKNTANLYSISDSAKLGGQVGWVEESQLSEIIKKAISKLKVGEYTKPITIPGGFLILHIDEKWFSKLYYSDFTDINPKSKDLEKLICKILNIIAKDCKIIITSGIR